MKAIDEANNSLLDNVNAFLQDIRDQMAGISGSMSNMTNLIGKINGSMTSALSFQNVKLNVFGCELAPTPAVSDSFIAVSIVPEFVILFIPVACFMLTVSPVELSKPSLITVVLDAPSLFLASTALVALRAIEPLEEIFKISPAPHVRRVVVAVVIVVKQAPA